MQTWVQFIHLMWQECFFSSSWQLPTFQILTNPAPLAIKHQLCDLKLPTRDRVECALIHQMHNLEIQNNEMNLLSSVQLYTHNECRKDNSKPLINYIFVKFDISYFQRKLRGQWKFMNMITRAKNQFLGGSIPWKHPVRPKMQVKCSQFAFLGIPRVFVQNLLWRFTDNPFWRSVLFIQQQGQNWQAVPCTGERLTYKE